MRENAKAKWAAATPVASCTKHVVCVENGEQHPVHYLEDTVPNFYQAFLRAGLCKLFRQYMGCGPYLASKIEGKPCRDFLKGATSKIEQKNQNLTVDRNFLYDVKN